MNKRIKKLWIESLRSKNYIKCSGDWTKDVYRFSAIGVLADIYRIEVSKQSYSVFWQKRKMGLKKLSKWSGLGVDSIWYIEMLNDLEYAVDVNFERVVNYVEDYL